MGLLAKARIWIDGIAFYEHAANGVEWLLAARLLNAMKMLENCAVEPAEQEVIAASVLWTWTVGKCEVVFKVGVSSLHCAGAVGGQQVEAEPEIDSGAHNEWL